jgi:hypothetical protein
LVLSDCIARNFLYTTLALESLLQFHLLRGGETCTISKYIIHKELLVVAYRRYLAVACFFVGLLIIFNNNSQSHQFSKPESTLTPTSVAIETNLPTNSVEPSAIVTANTQVAELPPPAFLPTIQAITQLSSNDTLASKRVLDRPWRVGLQAGHWHAEQLPDELKHLQSSSGAQAAGYNEAMITLDVAQRTAALLTSVGIEVDILPAVIPPGYQADAFIAIHADGAVSSARGYKVSPPWAASHASLRLSSAIEQAYGQNTQLPLHPGITANMRGYYSFNYRRYEHTIARTTPAVIIELGFLTNAQDRALLTQQPDLSAVGLANGIITFLNQHDPNDLQALQPPDYGVWRSKNADLTLRKEPKDNATKVMTVDNNRPLIAFDQSNGWYRVLVAGAWDTVGWVPQSELEQISE